MDQSFFLEYQDFCQQRGLPLLQRKNAKAFFEAADVTAKVILRSPEAFYTALTAYMQTVNARAITEQGGAHG